MTEHPFSLTRRDLLRRLFLTGSAAMTPAWLAACGGSGGATSLQSAAGGGGQLNIPLGPLSAIPGLGSPDMDGVAVPEGFRVRNVARQGSIPAVGSLYPWHIFPDGGATYARDNGGWIYVSNSEVPSIGGVGALVFDPPADEGSDPPVVDAYSILNGTSTNCAGGKTPWNTWLSCEEIPDGQVHECDPFGMVGGVVKPALGMFDHEAAVVDIRNRTVYMTEDTGDGRFYRWVADESDFSESDQRLALENGRLQVMHIPGFADGGYPETEDVRNLNRVAWKDVLQPDMPQADVRAGMDNPPGTRFDGGEGLWFYELPPEQRRVPPGGTVPTRGLVFWSTKGDNRIWALDIENQLVEIIFDNEQIEPDFNDVDNVTVSPWGDIVVAEDLVETGRGIRIMIVVPNVGARVLVEVDHPGSEITGPAFSPDGSRMYFSSQRGPNIPGGQGVLGQIPQTPGSGLGATYELFIPPEFRGDTT